jgi:hypothetical protein
MRNDNDVKEYKKTIGWLLTVIVVGIFAFIISGTKMCNKPKPNPRLKNGVDTLYTDDSGYTIRFYIDSVFEIERDYEPPERPD